MEFCYDELSVMRPFDGSCRATLIWEMRQALPDVYQPDMKRAMKSAIRKLAAMTDEEFDAQNHNDTVYDSGWEEYDA